MKTVTVGDLIDILSQFPYEREVVIRRDLPIGRHDPGHVPIQINERDVEVAEDGFLRSATALVIEKAERGS